MPEKFVVNNQRTRLICFRVTEGQFETLDQLWKLHGWRSMSDFLRTRVSELPGEDNVYAYSNQAETIRSLQEQISELCLQVRRIDAATAGTDASSESNQGPATESEI
jgi:hypothetical protein